MKIFLILAIFCFGGFITGCTSKAKSVEDMPAVSAPTENVLNNTGWRAESFGPVDDQQIIAANSSQGFTSSIEFSETRFGGRIAGCNIVTYDYKVSNTKISAKPLSVTAMACAPEVMKQETEISKASEKINEFRVNGQQLELLYDDGNVIRAKRVK